MNKIAILVDVQNIYYTTRQAFSRKFNYRAFWSTVTEGREVIAAYAYAIESRDGGKQFGFQQILRDIGFEVKLKPYIQRSDGSAKGDWDVGITLDMVELAEQVDTVVLASGDGDFDLALQRIRQRFDVTAEVYGVEQLTAGTLIRSATRYVPIEDDLLMPQ
ncbi:LabA-like NYN domain-containing protein [Mariniblastus fucicola]|uniref:NYN domain protein n=1 Tax=Mariniblastus fucicola TaxID=980251 RepID=A0A5B9PLQ2_9BACT|nr:NYN domain-containing protein [Mariniblastus fucicola]QEG23601.1 NYN domain protein [Mariniblastus fucicola]